MIKLNDIAEIKTGLVLNRKKADMSKDQKLYYSVVSLKSFNVDAIYDNTFADEFISNEQIKEDYQVKQGDILLSAPADLFGQSAGVIRTVLK